MSDGNRRTASVSTRRVYLAGPDVFLPYPAAVAARKKSLCRKYGFEGVFPLDADVPPSGLTPRQQALRISAANENLIRGSHLVVANITPFRGPSADVGTAYEMGFARGLGLPVFAYTNVSAKFLERTSKSIPRAALPRDGEVLSDEYGMTIEPFGLLENLMLEGAVAASGARIVVHEAPERDRFTDLSGFEACLVGARTFLGLGPTT